MAPELESNLPPRGLFEDRVMKASKENARAALARVTNEASRPQTTLSLTDYEFLKEFLIACVSRLPREAAYKRDEEKRKAKAGR